MNEMNTLTSERNDPISITEDRSIQMHVDRSRSGLNEEREINWVNKNTDNFIQKQIKELRPVNKVEPLRIP